MQPSILQLSLLALVLTAACVSETSGPAPVGDPNDVVTDGYELWASAVSDRNTAAADGHDGIHLFITITNQGAPFSGAYVSVNTDGVGDRWNPITDTTDSSGTVDGWLTSTTPGPKTLALSLSGYFLDYIGLPAPFVSPPSILFTPPVLAAYSAALTVDRADCRADGRCQITVVASIQDTLGHPMPNARLNLQVSGHGNRVRRGTQTGLSGQVVSHIRSTNAEVKTLSVALGYNGQTVTLAEASVTFTNSVSTVQPCPTGVLMPARPLLWTDVAPAAMGVGDFNGDGNADIALTDQRQGNNVIAFGDGDGSFAPLVPVGSAKLIRVADDFDGDGTSDLVVDNGNNTFVTWLFNVGGRAQASQTTGVGVPASSAHVNADAFLDLIAVDANAISVWLGKGDGTFAAAKTLTNRVDFLTGFGVGDLNGDALDDVVTAGGEDSIEVFLAVGDGNFASPKMWVGNQLAGELGIADVSGDGKPDLMGVQFGRGSLAVLVGRGDGTFDANRLMYRTDATYLGGPAALRVGDINGDTVPDVIVTGWGYVASMLGSGHGGFVQGGLYDLSGLDGQSPTFGLADFDLDGSADLAIAVERGPPGLVLAMGSVNGFDIKRSAGLLKSARGTYEAGRLSLADFNGDGLPDLVQSDQFISTFFSNGDGTFYETYVAEEEASALISVDLNGDGQSDIVTSNGNVLTGAGDGRFSLADRFYGPPDVTDMVAADFNGDGYADVGFYVGSPASGVEVAFSNGHGTLSSTTTFVDGPVQAACVAPGDLNADGIVDLVMPSTAGYLTIFTATGDGNFITRTLENVYAVHDVLAATVADFNNDDIADILLGAADEFYIALGDGTGGFVAGGTYSVMENSTATWNTADVDNDGNMDVIHSASYGNTVLTGGIDIALGRGDGTFLRAARYAPTFASSTVVEDFDGDGRPDIAVANTDDYQVMVLENGGCY